MVDVNTNYLEDYMEENLFVKYLRLQKAKKDLDNEILECQSALYMLNMEEFDSTDNGTIHHLKDGFKLTVVKKESVSVDQKLAANVKGFSVKYGFSKTEFNKLNDAEKAEVNKCLTTKPAKPSFKVEAI